MNGFEICRDYISGNRRFCFHWINCTLGASILNGRVPLCDVSQYYTHAYFAFYPGICCENLCIFLTRRFRQGSFLFFCSAYLLDRRLHGPILIHQLLSPLITLTPERIRHTAETRAELVGFCIGAIRPISRSREGKVSLPPCLHL